MNTIYLDCSQMREKEAAHTYLAQALALPAYYGRNLDALYDCLTDLGPCTLVLQNTAAWDDPEGYGQLLLPLFWQAASDNPGLQLDVQA